MKRLLCSLLLAAGALFAAQAAGASRTKALVVYFSFPIDGGREALDTRSGASVTVKDGVHYGNAEFIARTAAAAIGADLFEIDTGNHYPRDYNRIFDVTQSEQRTNTKPRLLKKVSDISAYDKIVICTPVWWYKMPLAVQAFLDEYDLSGKTIYLSVTHGGSRSAGIEREIAQAEPGATVSRNVLIVGRADTAKSEKQIADWARSL